jgi:DNA (cytosine-5)-methyltransferase 1
MLTVNELFAGIGSQAAALERLGIDFKVVGIAEIDKYAIKSYEAIHGPARNYGDISKIEKLDYADFWTYSFPCQDISVAGKQRGINENTRSGLLYEVERLLYKSVMYGEQPKYLMLENVKNLVGKKFKPQFEAWIKRLDELGYNTYWKVLNAKNYGIPQNRERVFAISIRKDIDTGYEFPVGFDNGKRLKDILENEVDEKYYLSDKIQQRLKITDSTFTKNIIGTTIGQDCTRIGQRDLVYQEDCIMGTLNATDYKQPKQILIPQATKQGYIECNIPGVADLSFPDSKTRRGGVQENGEICPTLTAGTQDICYIEQQFMIRKLTPLEVWRLMGFTDDQFYKAEKVNSNSQLYKQAGNSICVDVLYYLFKNLFLESEV